MENAEEPFRVVKYYSLKLTYLLKIGGWETIWWLGNYFPFGYVSFRECTFWMMVFGGEFRFQCLFIQKATNATRHFFLVRICKKPM